MIIDQIGLVISDFDKSKEFYSRALLPLNIELVTEEQGWAGYGKYGKPDFWFGTDENVQSPMHSVFCRHRFGTLYRILVNKEISNIICFGHSR